MSYTTRIWLNSLCCCSGNPDDITDDEFFLQSDARRFNESKSHSIETTADQQVTKPDVDTVVMSCNDDSIYFCNFLCDGPVPAEGSDYGPVAPAPPDMMGIYDEEIEQSQQGSTFHNQYNPMLGKNQFSLPPASESNYQVTRDVQIGSKNNFQMNLQIPNHSNGVENNQIYVNGQTNHCEDAEDDIDNVDIDWLVSVLSEEGTIVHNNSMTSEHGSSTQDLAYVHTQHPHELYYGVNGSHSDLAGAVDISNGSSHHMSDDTSSVSLSDISDISPTLSSKNSSMRVNKKGASSSSSGKAKLKVEQNDISKKKRTVSDSDHMSELNAKLVQTVKTLKVLKHVTAKFVHEVPPRLIAAYMSGTATVDIVNGIFTPSAMLTVPSQKSLATRASSQAPDSMVNGFIGLSNIVYGSAQLKEVMLQLISIRLPDGLRDASVVAFRAELVQLQNTAVSPSGEKLCANFVWYSSGLCSLGYPHEMTVQGLLSTTQHRGKVTKAIIAFDSDAVFRQLGLSNAYALHI